MRKRIRDRSGCHHLLKVSGPRASRHVRPPPAGSNKGLGSPDPAQAAPEIGMTTADHDLIARLDSFLKALVLALAAPRDRGRHALERPRGNLIGEIAH